MVGIGLTDCQIFVGGGGAVAPAAPVPASLVYHDNATIVFRVED